ncbi:hypothetical protein [Streptomyces bottropensis]|uniref:hypothetical protein n=1 Tax=Streptomyces TaxID=1883 RepID=UPI00036C057B|nr:hypothetical protein [Streptomyces bottropensis]MZD16846.1 hypothetical protein [Streptomyces sp. SID5476]
MAEIWDEQQLVADGFERVHVELAWYDGPREGIADVGGVPHYFLNHDFAPSDAGDEYRVWPADEAVLALEREQWAIFAKWYARNEAGTDALGTQPGQGGVNPRYDELDLLLAPHREAPDDARRFIGELRFDARARYRAEGVAYWFRWAPGR